MRYHHRKVSISFLSISKEIYGLLNKTVVFIALSCIFPCFPKISGNLGRQYGEAMKFLDEDVRQKQTEKQWREHLRIAWEISPALAVFLPQRMNNSPILQILQKEVTRYVRTYPEEVCHIPR